MQGEQLDGERLEGESLRVALIGSWILQRWAIEYPASGRTAEPFGSDAEGLLVYAADERMSVAMQRRVRPGFALSSQDSTADDKAAAFASYMHYAGRWHVESRDVVHEIGLA